MQCCIEGGLCSSKRSRKILTKRKQEVITDNDSTFFSLQQIKTTSLVVLDDSVASGVTGEVACGVKKPVKVRKHKCSKCHRSFHKPNKLRAHVDFAHLNIYHNVCDHVKADGTECEYKCEQAGALEKHIRRKHTGKRPHKCWDCSEAFAAAGERKTHWVINCSPADHVDRTKYKCTGCQKGFPTPCALRDHYLRNCAPLDDPDRITFLKKRCEYINGRYANDETFRIHHQVALGLREFMKRMGLGKHTRTKEMLGCTYEELVVHLNNNERGFVYGAPGTEYHIDHIKPKSSFKKGCRLQLLEACNFNNLQLLPGPENLKKSDKFTPEASEAFYKSVGGIAILALREVWKAERVCACESCM
jgi:hypothetical protein